MLFSSIFGQTHIKKHLATSANLNRIAHAQLFVGPQGSGTLPMALAYSQYILCKNSDGENLNGNESCNIKCNNFSHPDIHFAFPVTTTDNVKSHPVSKHFKNEWRQFLTDQPYGSLFDWYKLLNVEQKQGQIGVDEAHDIIKALSLKSYEGGHKIMIIWMAEKMNTACANKLLKLIEEPPSQTIFILIAEQEELIINTIRSRCQTFHFPPLSESIIKEALIKQFNLNEIYATKIAQQANGNYNKAIGLAKNKEVTPFEKWFVSWIRTAFRAKGNKSSILDLLSWSEAVSKSGRETQKQFLLFCSNLFRQALLLNYTSKELVHFQPTFENFELERFAPFVHNNNIIEINNALQDAIYHIERNGNSKIILTDLSIKLTRLLHKKSI